MTLCIPVCTGATNEAVTRSTLLTAASFEDGSAIWMVMILSIIETSLSLQNVMTEPQPAFDSAIATPDVTTVAAPSCDRSMVHLDRVRQVQQGLLTTDRAQRMAELFGVLSDPHRLKLLSALAQQELCVCDLAAIVKMGESAVSHQLRVLRSQRLVCYRRQGRNVYYSLADEQIVTLYQTVANHLHPPMS